MHRRMVNQVATKSGSGLNVLRRSRAEDGEMRVGMVPEVVVSRSW